MADLILVVTADSLEREIPLSSEPLTIGRAEDNGLALADPAVSRHHAVIEASGVAAAVLTDLGSANGTFLNGERLAPNTPATLSSSDEVKLGGTSLRIRVSEPVIPPGEAATLVQTLPMPPSPAPQPAPTPAPIAEAPPRPAANPFAKKDTPRPAPAEAAQRRTPEPPEPEPAETSFAQVQPRLVVTWPAGTFERPLLSDLVTIGRDPANDIQIDSHEVSRRHAELRRSGQTFELVDLGSANGLVHGGEKVTSHTLTDGDEVRIGEEIVLVFHAPLAQTQAVRMRPFDLKSRESTTIGRAAGSDVRIDQPTVSRSHARIVQEGGGYRVEDLGSSNGTFIDGVQLKPHVLTALPSGATIGIGPFRFELRGDQLTPEDESRDLSLDCLRVSQTVGKGVTILHDISLAIQPREFVAVVGASGSGKSTLVGALSGFRPASGGAVRVNAKDLYENFDLYRTSLGYVPQDDIIHKTLPVRRALEYAAALRLPLDTGEEERAARVTEVLDELGLAQRTDVPVEKLSGGQRKRVSIGVELLTRPGLFFLDEATSGLDPGTENQMMRLLRKLADDGHTVVLITHATKNVRQCDQVVFLARGGHLAFYGPPDEALTYFGVDDFDQIYEKLEGESTPEAWSARYRESAPYRKYVVERLEAKYGGRVLDMPPASRETKSVPPQPAAVSRKESGSPLPLSTPVARHQFKVLSRRYLDIIFRDRVNMALLFLLAPALGAVDLIAWPRDVFDQESGDIGRAMSMLFVAAIVPFLVGSLSSVREIVKESAIYQRERTVTLQIAPYLLSKIAIGFLFALYHAAALLLLKLLKVDFADAGAGGVLEIYVLIALAAMSGVMWGLLISALAPREEQAMLLIIGIVVVQIVFSGALIKLSDLGAPGQVVGAASSTRWTFAGMTAASGITDDGCADFDIETCKIPGLLSTPDEAAVVATVANAEKRYGDILGASVGVSVVALVVTGGVLFVALYVLQKRKDVV